MLPRKIEPKQTTKFTLDLAPPKGGWQRGGRLRIQGESTLGESRWRARLNGAELTPTDNVSEPYPNPYPSLLGKPEELRAWVVPAKVLSDGLNRLELTMETGQPVRLAFLDLPLS